MQKSRIRNAMGLVILTLLLAAFALQTGLLDSLVRWRVEKIAWHRTEEWKNHWYGVELLQYPNDLMIYQDLVYEVRPDVIVETGTFKGGLALYLATLLEVQNPAGKIVTVDVSAEPWQRTVQTLDVPGRQKLLERITFIEGDSAAPAVVDRVRQNIPPGSKVLVLLDSLHTKEHVLKELRQYASLVTPDSYLIVNDTYLDGWYQYRGSGENAGAFAAVKEFLAANAQFQVDAGRNRFVVSCAPSGFLKRVE